MSDSSETRDGESTQAEPRPATSGSTKSVGEILNRDLPQKYVKGIAGAMAGLGISLGILVMLLGAFGNVEFTAGSATISSQRYKLSLVNNVIGYTPFLAFPLAVLFGLRVADVFDTDRRKGIVTAVTGVFVGTVLLVMITEMLATTQAPTVQGTSYSLDYATALVNSLVIGVATSVAAAATVYSSSRFSL
ncbi:hypothetical protein [Salarchaeum japonicum]|uniref:hypothetical protein n=1 Tax=Salarchaeum japonicum TaxID=555573 RepID=UPI003C763F05